MRADQDSTPRATERRPDARRRRGRVGPLPPRQAGTEGRSPGWRARRRRRPGQEPRRRPQRRAALRYLPGPSADPRRRAAPPAARAERARRPPAPPGARPPTRSLPANGAEGAASMTPRHSPRIVTGGPVDVAGQAVRARTLPAEKNRGGKRFALAGGEASLPIHVPITEPIPFGDGPAPVPPHVCWGNFLSPA